MDIARKIMGGMLAIVLSLFGVSAPEVEEHIKQPFSDMPLAVHYIDVGQGDSCFIKLPNGEAMLIDAGENDKGPDVVSYIKKLGIKKIDYLVATHPHSDHIGGIDDVINSFDIGTMYMPSATNNTKTFTSVLDAVEKKKVSLKRAKAGVNILSENNLKIELLAPCRDSYDDLNNYSAVVKLTYGKTSFLFMGDAEKLSENDIDSPLSSDVLKVGHHGSNSSTGDKFLKSVSPKVALISVGENNDYGHPTDKVLKRLEKANVKIFRTDRDGTVVIGSNGESVAY